jgi:hypothetical protein
MAKKIFIENSFDGSPGGSGGMSYGGSYGTPNSSTQDPSKFSSSDKTTNHMASNTESTSSAMMQPPDRPDRIGRNSNTISTTPDTGDTVRLTKPNTVSPDTNYDVQKSQKPLDPDKELDPKVDQLFKGKEQTPSPDEVMSALQYELGNMVKKDKMIAKQTVIKNMKTDPHYYSRLDMLNIDDKKMKVDETVKESTFSKTKSVLDEMIAARKKTAAKAATPELNQIFKDLSNRRCSTRSGI